MSRLRVETEDDKEKAFAAIKHSIRPEYDDPDGDQQKAIDALDRQTGFNPKGKKKNKDEKAEDLPKYYVQKFSDDTMLAESVLIGGLPFFLVVRKGTVTIEDHCVFPDKILKPLEPLSYVNKAYSFGSDIEVDAYLTKVNPDTLDSLPECKSNLEKVCRC